MDRFSKSVWALVVPLLAVTAGCGSGPGTGKGGGSGESTSSGSSSGFTFDEAGTTTTDAGESCNLNVTCASAGATCGPIGNGCGGVIQCGDCAKGTTCGGGGVLGACGTLCQPKTCGDLGVECGKTGDGCGGELDCGSCNNDPNMTCRGFPSKCVPLTGDGGLLSCTPATCASLGATCGVTGDGCGGRITCGDANGGCPDGTMECRGNPPTCQPPQLASQCTPQTCSSAHATCGSIGDGCGGTTQISCGAGCNPGTICSGVPGNCVVPTIPVDDAGVPKCHGRTCADFGANCGKVGDGCGNLLDCINPTTGTTSCPAGTTCGGAGTQYQCGVPPIQCLTPNKQPLTCQKQTVGADGGAPVWNCGIMGDGCGGLIDCGACPDSNAVCGGDTPASAGNPVIPGVSNQCPQPQPCTGLCLQQPTCNPARSACVSADQCKGGTDTVITGVVYAPGHDDVVTWGNPDALDNVLVYIPSSTVKPFALGISCDVCGDDITGDPLVSTTTPDVIDTTRTGAPAGDQLHVAGSFTLKHAPAGKNIPLVIQTGRWRRQLVISEVKPCTTTTLSATNVVQGPVATGTTTLQGTATTVRLPRSKSEGDIPHMAFSTGNVDRLECVLRKMGIDDSEFTDSTGTGRVHLFTGVASTRGSGALGGAVAPGNNTANENVLLNSSATVPSATAVALANYDQVLFACQGADDEKSTGQRQAILDYANKGGRVYATHYNYHWIYDNPTSTTGWATTAHWNVDRNNNRMPNPQTQDGIINYQTAAPAGAAAGDAASIKRVLGLANWLYQNNISTTFGRIPISVLRNDAQGAIVPPSVDFIDINDPKYGLVTMHLTFDTPISGSTKCGRVLYDDFHVEDTTATTPRLDTNGKQFPQECCDSNQNLPCGATMTPQEHLLEYMLFDLGSCITTPPSICTPKSCTDQGIECGSGSDGCGVALDCGSCASNQICGGCGVAGQCCTPPCNPVDCSTAGGSCGSIGDGCGNVINCPCPLDPPGQVCGGCGTPGQCCVPPCTPSTCAAQGIQCGMTPDGCGAMINCGGCPEGQLCGACGQPGVCCSPGLLTCSSTVTCPSAHVECGPVSDGCGGVQECGSCPVGQVCGGCGTPGQCCAPPCTPVTCSEQGVECGAVEDGCGSTLDCGNCSADEACGGCNQPGVCCKQCTPRTCVDLGAECGLIGDGCGGTLDCGQCTNGCTCGGLPPGKPNVCGACIQ